MLPTLSSDFRLLVATPWTRVSTQTSLIAIGPCGKDDLMQTRCLADARFALVHECLVQLVGAHAPVVPGHGSPNLRLVFQKGHLAAQTWWAQVGSNHRLLACKSSSCRRRTLLGVA